MSRQAVSSSLDAVEQALEHFVASLDRAGFADGAGAYRQMADVVIGQWMWAEQTGARDLQPRFLRIASLAGNVAEQLRQYVSAMEQLRGLRGLAGDAWDIEPGSTTERIVESLASSAGGMTMSELRQVTGASTVALRRELDRLVGKGIVGRPAGPRGRYLLAG